MIASTCLWSLRMLKKTRKVLKEWGSRVVETSKKEIIALKQKSMSQSWLAEEAWIHSRGCPVIDQEKWTNKTQTWIYWMFPLLTTTSPKNKEFMAKCIRNSWRIPWILWEISKEKWIDFELPEVWLIKSLLNSYPFSLVYCLWSQVLLAYPYLISVDYSSFLPSFGYLSTASLGLPWSRYCFLRILGLWLSCFLPQKTVEYFLEKIPSSPEFYYDAHQDRLAEFIFFWLFALLPLLFAISIIFGNFESWLVHSIFLSPSEKTIELSSQPQHLYMNR